MKHLKSTILQAAANPAVIAGGSRALYLGVTLAVMSGSALADGASTKSTLVNIFNWLYGLIGAIGGITLLVQFINAKAGNFLGTQDPRKQIITTMIFVGLAFAVVGIIQAIKTWAGSGAGVESL